MIDIVREQFFLATAQNLKRLARFLSRGLPVLVQEVSKRVWDPRWRLQLLLSLRRLITINRRVDLGIRLAYAALWLDYARKVWQLSEEIGQQKIALVEHLAELRDEYRKDTQGASERLRLVERSPRRKAG